MSLETRVKAALTSIGADIKSLKTSQAGLTWRDVTDITLAGSSGITSASRLTRRYNHVEIYFDITVSANKAANTQLIPIPTDHYAAMLRQKVYWAFVASSGATSPVYYDPATHTIKNLFAITSGTQLVGEINYIG